MIPNFAVLPFLNDPKEFSNERNSRSLKPCFHKEIVFKVGLIWGHRCRCGIFVIANIHLRSNGNSGFFGFFKWFVFLRGEKLLHVGTCFLLQQSIWFETGNSSSHQGRSWRGVEPARSWDRHIRQRRVCFHAYKLTHEKWNNMKPLGKHGRTLTCAGEFLAKDGFQLDPILWKGPTTTTSIFQKFAVYTRSFKSWSMLLRF